MWVDPMSLNRVYCGLYCVEVKVREEGCYCDELDMEVFCYCESF